MDRYEVELASEFCDVLFATLSAVGLFPEEPDAPDHEFEEPGLLLVKRLRQYEDPEPGYLEWVSEVLRQEDGKRRQETFPELIVLRNWVIEMSYEFGDEVYRHLEASLLARARQWQFSLKKNLLSLAEAEQDWGMSNLRQNARGRLPMWKVGRNWVTTRSAMWATFGEPQEEKTVKTEVKMDGEIYMQLREILPTLKEHGLKHFDWHPDSTKGVFHGDVLRAANEAFEDGGIDKAQSDLVFDLCEPEALS